MPLTHKILVVDDDESVRSFLQDFLNDREMDAEAASNGEEALQKIPKLQPSVVLLDIMMPGMGGVACLEKIKKQFPAIQVVMISGAEDAAVMDQAKKLGAADYISKPFSLEYLETKLLTLLGKLK